MKCHIYPFFIVQLPSCIQLFATSYTAARQASLSLTISWSLPKFTVLALVMPSRHLILWCPLLLLPSICPSIKVFSNELSICIRWPKYWSFSISLPMSIQDWFQDGLVWSPCCLRDSQESSPALQFESISSSVLSLLYGLALTFIHDYWKDHSFDYMDFCWLSDVFAF